MQEEIKWLCWYAPSLGELEGDPEQVWGTREYEPLDGFSTDLEEPTVFFGLYGLPDFFKLWRHKGRRCILWAGSDITNFKNGYWLEDGGGIKLSPRPLATWINKYCESYIENEVEQVALKEMGIESKVVPSFLGNVEDFPLSYKPTEKIRLYTSVSGDNFKLYGWDLIPKLAEENPEIEFHLYGNTVWPFKTLPTENPFSEQGIYKGNIIIHGRVSKEQMNKEIKEMTGALRLTEFDGMSEIVVKSLLWGQWPVSIIEYPHTLKPENIDLLLATKPKEPNIKGREWLLSVVNKYPWNSKK